MAAEYDIAEAFERIENDLISGMIRNFKRHRAEETAEGYNWSQWQAEQLRALEEYKKHNRKKYGTEFKSINSQLDELLRTTYKDASAAQEREMIEAVRNGFELPKPPEKGIEGAFFKTDEGKLDALIKSTTDDMEKAEYAALRRCDDRYRKIIYKAQVAANTGALTYEQAVDMATKDFLSSGVDCIVYKNGARHGIKEYSRMAIRTANKRSNLMGEGAKRDKMGVRTVIVNKRHNDCPHCARYVGRAFIDDVYSHGTKSDGDYPLLSEAIRGGLFHPNCRDGTSTYYPELTELEELYPLELTELEKRDTLETKREAARNQAEKYERMSVHSLDAKNRRKYAARAKEWREREAEVDDQLKAMEEKPKPKPEKPKTEKPKPEQPKPSDAKTAEKPLEKPEKPVEKSGENGIIKEKIISASNNEKTNKENTSKISNSESKTEESIDYSRVGSRSFSKEAQTRMLQQERIISGQKYETGILYKSNGEVSFSKKGKADEVHFTKSEIEKMKGCVLTHNHPNGSVFSPEDINILRRGQLAEIRACNGKGAYVLRSNSEWSSEISDLSSIKDAYWDCYEQAGMKYRDIAAQEGKHILLYMRRIEEEGISSFAKKFNLEFTWEAKL